jgi:ammonium transporter, Amt family
MAGNASNFPGCDAINDGDTGMMMMATTFVMLQTPALGLAQAGIIRRKNALSMLMQTLTGFTLGSLLWFFCGFSLTFGHSVGDAGVIGNLQNMFFDGVSATHCYPNSTATTIPGILFAAFQMMFAVMVPVIVTGAWAERMLFEAFIVFVTVWPFLVYYPLAHWVWNTEGWLARLGVVDFAGGLTIHTSTGVAALAVTFILSGRLKIKGLSHHNLPIAILGGSIIWGAWYSFNGGSAFKANGQAAIAVMNTHVSACVAAMVWTLLGYRRDRQWHVTEIMNGAFAGLAAITPGSGVVLPQMAFFIGLVGGLLSYYWVQSVKPKLGLDDALDVTALQGVPGIWGTFAVGLFAAKPYSPAMGLFYGGDGSLLFHQSVGIVVTVVWTFSMTYLLMMFIRRTVGIDVSASVEEKGLDISQIGEQAYDETLALELDLGTEMMTTKLCEACHAGDLQKVKQYVQVGTHADASDYDLRTPLHIAAGRNHVQILKYLIKQQHVPVNPKDKYGNTPLADALKSDNKEAVEYLKSEGGVVHSQSGYVAASTVYQATASGNAEELNWRIEQNKHCINEIDYDMRSPLHLAAAEGHEHIVKLLLKAGAKINAVDRWGNTPYNDALNHRHAGCVKLLSGSSQSNRGHVHVTIGEARKTTSHLSGLDNEKQPLLEMKEGDSGHYGTGEANGGGRERSNSLNAADRAILHAADEGDIEELKRLVRRGANINAKDYDDRSVLHLVCSNGHLKALQLLMASSDLIVDTFDRFGSTPLQDAIHRGHIEIAAILRSAGATVVNCELATRLCTFAAAGNLLEIKNLEARGSDMNVCDYDGRTALHLAACNNRVDIIRFLLSRGGKVKSRDRYGFTPIDDAKRYNNGEAVALLLQ